MGNVFTADLAVTKYSNAAVAFSTKAALLASATPARSYYNGDFSNADPIGGATISFPFAQEGDNKTVTVKQRFRQLASAFRALALGTPFPDNAGLLLINEADFQDDGGGLVSWTRTYSNIPQQRDTFESFSYGFQYVFTDTSGNFKVGEQAFTVASRVRSEYFLIKDLGAWPALLAPRICPITDNYYYKRGQGDLHVEEIFVVSRDPQILAEDSTFKVWNYPIMERRSRWIAAPTRAFWGTAAHGVAS